MPVFFWCWVTVNHIRFGFVLCNHAKNYPNPCEVSSKNLQSCQSMRVSLSILFSKSELFSPWCTSCWFFNNHEYHCQHQRQQRQTQKYDDDEKKNDDDHHYACWIRTVAPEAWEILTNGNDEKYNENHQNCSDSMLMMIMMMMMTNCWIRKVGGFGGARSRESIKTSLWENSDREKTKEMMMMMNRDDGDEHHHDDDHIYYA